MKALRILHDSAVLAVKAVLEDPEEWPQPFTVLTEEEMRAGISPSRPFVYLLRPYTPFTLEHLPVVMVEVTGNPAEMGLGETGMRGTVNLHIFGRSWGEVEDIAWALARSIQSFQFVKDGQVLFTVPIVPSADGVLWVEQVVEPRGEIAEEGSLSRWLMLSAEVHFFLS